ncbi:hypothetical protein QR680_003587 [Steinernema hermaphroditum]|uniref:Ground-like domain-containing protein n=1 Tax=Steinernema hermaphroditum TaxID=289476 RepID=A0AA39LS79_9BILA|nr:hypothetical protein QR680_003587 [Steinernema hermaphroditum]
MFNLHNMHNNLLSACSTFLWLLFSVSFLFFLLGPSSSGTFLQWKRAEPKPPGVFDEEDQLCHDPILREVIEESLTFQLDSSSRRLSTRLRKPEFLHKRYAGVCTKTEEQYKLFTDSKNYCTHGNEEITCHVFQF